MLLPAQLHSPVCVPFSPCLSESRLKMSPWDPTRTCFRVSLPWAISNIPSSFSILTDPLRLPCPPRHLRLPSILRPVRTLEGNGEACTLLYVKAASGGIGWWGFLQRICLRPIAAQTEIQASWGRQDGPLTWAEISAATDKVEIHFDPVAWNLKSLLKE